MMAGLPKESPPPDPLARVRSVAREYLAIELGEEERDLWLWERAERVSRLVALLTHIPELAEHVVDRLAVQVGGLFSCAGWAVQAEQGRFNRWQLLTRPTNDIQRELGAALLQENVAHLLPNKTARLAAEAVRQCNDRGTALIEAQILSEAENLDDIGVLYILRQFRQYQAEGRPLVQLIDSWSRQKEYRYWDVRLNEGFRFETARQLARERIFAVESFVQALARDMSGHDIVQALQRAGIDLNAPHDSSPPNPESSA
jgi:hypothetical protein